jgi:hypothetical protein
MTNKNQHEAGRKQLFIYLFDGVIISSEYTASNGKVTVNWEG